MDVLLAALGTTAYIPVHYADHGEKPSPYFTYLLVEKHRPDRVVLLLTDEAKKRHWDAESFNYKDGQDEKTHPALRKELEGLGYKQDQDRVITPDGFPYGRNEEELWKAFNMIIEAVPENCNLILDVTNSFRTLPMLMLLAAIYLRQAKNVTLKGIYYGAFDAKSKDEQGREVCPVFELTRFITLADWANAVRAFKVTGDTALLAQSLSSLSETDSQERLKSASEQSLSGLSEASSQDSLKNTSERLTNFATYLDLGLPLEVQSTAAQLLKDIQAAETALAELKAFKTLLEQVRGELESFAQAGSRNLDQMEETLKRQLSLIRWLKEKRTSTATLLAQEWIVSQGVVQKEERESIFEWNSRKKIKNPQIEALSKIRNQFAHGGWTAEPLDVEASVSKAKEIIDALKDDMVISKAVAEPQPNSSGAKPTSKRKRTKKNPPKGKKPRRR